MENKQITNHAALMRRIVELKADKSVQEVTLRITFLEMISTLDLMSIFSRKKSEDAPLNLMKTGVNMALDLTIDMILGKHRSVKGFLSSALVENFSRILINNNLINIISGISSLLNRKTQYERSQE
ncbi:MAG: hypothetical protein KBG33_08220 [Paludibacteraceae bacterium]|jgi:hypothetical protein|nr:hypothetical protein [Paludibacteraceae bacterium]